MTSPIVRSTDEGSGDSIGTVPGGIGRDGRLERDHPRETTVKYCLHCDWTVRAADGYSRGERSSAAVDHFAATGHTVDSL